MEDQADLVAKIDDYSARVNSAGLNTFRLDEGGLGFFELPEMFDAPTGWNWASEDLRAT